jgi:antitoxin VapB
VERLMNMERKAAIFRNGRNQAVRIPKEFELPGKEAIIRKEGSRLVIEAIDRKQGLFELLSSWEALPEAERMPKIDDHPPEPVDL